MPNTALNFIRSNNLSSSYKESNKTKSPQSCEYALKRLSPNGLAKWNVNYFNSTKNRFRLNLKSYKFYIHEVWCDLT